MDRHALKMRARSALDPLVGALSALRVPPLLVSLAGVAVSVYGAMVVADGGLLLGGVLLLVAGICDVIDGDLARRAGTPSRFGAFIDSTLDRVAEFAYFGGIAVYIVNRPGGFSDYELAVVFVALAGSVLTSYARARAEGIGVACTVGAVGRPERVALLALGLLLGYRVLFVVLNLIAIASMYTFVQRVIHVHRATSRLDEDVDDYQPNRD